MQDQVSFSGRNEKENKKANVFKVAIEKITSLCNHNQDTEEERCHYDWGHPDSFGYWNPDEKKDDGVVCSGTLVEKDLSEYSCGFGYRDSSYDVPVSSGYMVSEEQKAKDRMEQLLARDDIYIGEGYMEDENGEKVKVMFTFPASAFDQQEKKGFMERIFHSK